MGYIPLILVGLVIALLGFWALSDIWFACKVCFAASGTSEYWKWAWGDAAGYLGGIPFVVVIGVPVYLLLMVILPMMPKRFALHRAMRESVVPRLRIEQLISAHPTLINQQDASGNMPLHIAAKHRSYQIVEALLANGADAKAKNNQGETALDVVPKKSISPENRDRKINRLRAAIGSSA